MMVPLFALAVALAQAPQAPSLEELKNATYTGITNEAVTLKDGVFEGPPFVAGGAARPRIELARLIVATGAVGPDRRPAAAVILMESGGGTGLRHYLALVGRDGAAVRNVSTVAVGDRVALRALSIRDAAVVLDVIAHGPGEPACCPTQKQRRTWRFEKGTLTEAPAQVLGTVSMADLEGTAWALTSLNLAEPLPEPAVATLQVTAGRIGGRGGCNRFNGTVTPGAAPGALTVGRLMSTMMACPEPVMGVERRFLKALERVTSFTFVQGHLALAYRDGDTLRTLMFKGEAGGWR